MLARPQARSRRHRCFPARQVRRYDPPAVARPAPTRAPSVGVPALTGASNSRCCHYSTFARWPGVLGGNSRLAEHSHSRGADRAYTSTVRDVLDELLTVWRAGGTAGVATVVRTIRSAPRQPGATMVVAPDGTVAGSVSGGCVEAAVYELANEVVASGRPELQRYGVSDDDAFAVGLTCGGHHRHLRRADVARHFPSAGGDRRRHRRASSDRRRHRDRAPGSATGWGAGWSIGQYDRRRVARIVSGRRRGHRRRAGTAGRRAHRRCCPTDPTGSARRRAWRCSSPATPRAPRMLIFGAIDFAVGAGPAGRFPRLSRDGVRRAPGLRHPGPVSRRRRGGRRLAGPLSRGTGRGGRHRLAHRDLRAHPRPQVRRPRPAGRAAAAARSTTSA